MVEAIGIPEGWYMCQDSVKSGGRIAMLGVHGVPATINLEKIWYRNFTFTAGMSFVSFLYIPRRYFPGEDTTLIARRGYSPEVRKIDPTWETFFEKK